MRYNSYPSNRQTQLIAKQSAGYPYTDPSYNNVTVFGFLQCTRLPIPNLAIGPDPVYALTVVLALVRTLTLVDYSYAFEAQIKMLKEENEALLEDAESLITSQVDGVRLRVDLGFQPNSSKLQM